MGSINLDAWHIHRELTATSLMSNVPCYMSHKGCKNSVDMGECCNSTGSSACTISLIIPPQKKHTNVVMMSPACRQNHTRRDSLPRKVRGDRDTRMSRKTYSSASKMK